MIQKEELFQLGFFAKPHGVKGEITLLTDYDVFDESKDPYIVCEMDGILVPFFIESFRYKGNSSILVKLEQVDDELALRDFVNKTVYYPKEAIQEQVLNLDSGHWTYFVDFMLSDVKYGEIGKVLEVDDTTLNVLFRTSYQDKELLIPVAEELIVSVDHKNRKLTLSLPEGLLGL